MNLPDDKDCHCEPKWLIMAVAILPAVLPVVFDAIANEVSSLLKRRRISKKKALRQEIAAEAAIQNQDPHGEEEAPGEGELSEEQERPKSIPPPPKRGTKKKTKKKPSKAPHSDDDEEPGNFYVTNTSTEHG